MRPTRTVTRFSYLARLSDFLSFFFSLILFLLPNRQTHFHERERGRWETKHFIGMAKGAADRLKALQGLDYWRPQLMFVPRLIWNTHFYHIGDCKECEWLPLTPSPKLQMNPKPSQGSLSFNNFEFSAYSVTCWRGYCIDRRKTIKLEKPSSRK